MKKKVSFGITDKKFNRILMIEYWLELNVIAHLFSSMLLLNLHVLWSKL